jgi:serine/threonine protein kinase
MIDSLEQLSKSQLFSLKGETLVGMSSADGEGLRDQPDSLQLDNIIIDQKYKIICLLGEGGMGTVYKAHHLLLDKDVALKTFRSPNLIGCSWERFRREAQAIARLSHKNIVQVFDFGVELVIFLVENRLPSVGMPIF